MPGVKSILTENKECPLAVYLFIYNHLSGKAGKIDQSEVNGYLTQLEEFHQQGFIHNRLLLL